MHNQHCEIIHRPSGCYFFYTICIYCYVRSDSVGKWLDIGLNRYIRSRRLHPRDDGLTPNRPLRCIHSTTPSVGNRRRLYICSNSIGSICFHLWPSGRRALIPLANKSTRNRTCGVWAIRTCRRPVAARCYKHCRQPAQPRCRRLYRTCRQSVCRGEIFSVQSLEQSSWQCHYSIEHIQLPIRL